MYKNPLAAEQKLYETSMACLANLITESYGSPETYAGIDNREEFLRVRSEISALVEKLHESLVDVFRKSSVSTEWWASAPFVQDIAGPFDWLVGGGIWLDGVPE